jgi:hypothetical protein
MPSSLVKLYKVELRKCKVSIKLAERKEEEAFPETSMTSRKGKERHVQASLSFRSDRCAMGHLGTFGSTGCSGRTTSDVRATRDCECHIVRVA